MIILLRIQENAYCQAVINPKLAKLRTSFSNLISE